MKNKRMEILQEQINKIAATDLNVLIVGGYGTGRDTAAQSIHKNSCHKADDMIMVDCINAAEKDLSLEGGAIYYMDEVHRLSGRAQLKMMREMQRVPDARIIASATKALGEKMDRKRFSYDLYRMISQSRIELPSITENQAYLKDLIRDTVKRLSKKYNKNVRISGTAMEMLMEYNYEADYVELENLLTMAVLVNKSGVIKSNSIMTILDMDNVIYATLIKGGGLDLHEELQRYERKLLVMALKDNGSVRKAAQQLGIAPTTLWNRCSQLGIVIKDKKTMQILGPESEDDDANEEPAEDVSQNWDAEQR